MKIGKDLTKLERNEMITHPHTHNNFFSSSPL